MKSKKYLLLSCVALLIVLSVLAACGPTGTETPAPAAKTYAPPPYTPPVVSAPTAAPQPTATGAPTPVKKFALKAAISVPANQSGARAMEWFADRINKVTNGRITVQNYMAGSLVAPKDGLDAVKNGLTDMLLHTFGFNAGQMPFGEWAGMVPFMWTLEGSKQFWPFLKEQYDKEFEQKGFNQVALFPVSSDQEWYFPKKAVWEERKNPNWKGLRFRVPGYPWNDIVRLFGGAIVQMASVDIPMAFSTGMIDALDVSTTSYDALDLYTKVPYVWMTWGTVNLTNPITINKQLLNSFPPDLRDIFLKTIGETHDYILALERDFDTNYFAKRVVEKGGAVYEFTKEDRDHWRQMVRPIHEPYLQKLGPDAKAWLEKLEALPKS